MQDWAIFLLTLSYVMVKFVLIFTSFACEYLEVINFRMRKYQTTKQQRKHFNVKCQKVKIIYLKLIRNFVRICQILFV